MTLKYGKSPLTKEQLSPTYSTTFLTDEQSSILIDNVQQLGRPESNEIDNDLPLSSQETNVSVTAERQSGTGLMGSFFRFSSPFSSSVSKSRPDPIPRKDSKPSAAESSESMTISTVVDMDLKGEVVISTPLHSDQSAHIPTEAKLTPAESSSSASDAVADSASTGVADATVDFENVMSTNYWYCVFAIMRCFFNFDDIVI